ncbi:MAG: hypothetical protein JXO51_04675 [Candidatus Aminicenantes bacterium]|nr:hypothetical protein [Candidatus Aminicenantes bacterium]
MKAVYKKALLLVLALILFCCLLGIGCRRQPALAPALPAAAHLEARGARVLVLGCTEIPLAFNPERATVPVLNATRVLAEAAIRRYSELSGH